MAWNNWKTWLLIAGVLVAAVALYAFASPDSELKQDPNAAARAAGPRAGVRAPVRGTTAAEEIDAIREYAPSQSSYSAGRNLFAFVEPVKREKPVEPAPTIIEQPPPPDADKDTVPDFRDNCPTIYNPDQTDIDRNGVGAACQQGVEVPPPPPLPPFPYKYIGTFGSAGNQIAAFSKDGEITNVRVGETFGGTFILRSIGIESVDIGYAGRSEKTRIAVGQ